jgi:putative sterol carrier protein
MTLDDVTAEIRQRFADAAALGASIKFDFAEAGLIHVDGTGPKNEIGNADKAADCVIEMALEDFVQLLHGELDPTTAFLLGKLKVQGDMGPALKLQSILG